MNFWDHQEFALARFKDMGSFNASLMHSCVGVAGEGGEVLDLAKKVWVYGKPLSEEMRQKFIEEIGDMMFYEAVLLAQLGIHPDQVRAANVAKLLKRYPEGYSDAAAQARADKPAGQ